MPSIFLFLWPLILSNAFNCYIKITAEESTSQADATVDLYQLPLITAFDPPSEQKAFKTMELHNLDYVNFVINMGRNTCEHSKSSSKALKHPIFQKNINHADHLTKLASREDVAFKTPQLKWFSDAWEKNKSNYSQQLLDVHSALRYLLDSKEVLPQEIAEWIDMFARVTLIHSETFVSLDLEALMRCGLYSLIVKFGGYDNDILAALNRHISALTNLLEKRLEPLEFKDRSAVWISELLFPRYGVSQPMRDYKTFVKETSYDSQFKAFYHLVDEKDSAQIQSKINNLIELSKKSSRGVSAASKAAAIVFLYHLARQKKNQVLRIQALDGIRFLNDTKYTNLFIHDRKLLEWIRENISIERKNEKNKAILPVILEE
ncbi:hypothetical protein O181_022562 [Austropuccinia psidii MF-1]|uniref:Uncharacterized protein n=1 Tax=Austropuccinia psidii MF-1 TaxID=1389203 RepID=A0A9Q3GX86_9BASI|nr:hypothetical protein [Austropuccinia psidii MF-1]